MEADGIVEGFSKSVEMHGLKFNKLIGNILYVMAYGQCEHDFFFKKLILFFILL